MVTDCHPRSSIGDYLCGCLCGRRYILATIFGFAAITFVPSILFILVVCTKPDISLTFGVVSLFLSNLGKVHWAAVKWILRYLRGTSKVCLCFGNGNYVLDGLITTYSTGGVDFRKFTSRGVLDYFCRGSSYMEI